MKKRILRTKKSVKLAVLLCFTCTLVVTSCSKEDNPDAPLTPTSIELISGGEQTSILEGTLSNPIEVQLLDQNRNPFAGVTINFEVTEGSLSVSTGITNTEGKAIVTWTLGDNIGEQVLTVKVDGVSNSLLVNAVATLVTGDFYKGGVVFIINSSGNHGFVCAVRDQSSSAPWGCRGTDINGANGTSLGSGAQNTKDIENGCNTTGTAADLCANLVSGGYSDWFLPARQLTGAMINNKSIIKKGSLENGGKGLTGNPYWCSSEFNANEAYRWEGFGGRRPLPKNALYAVRAVRAF